MKKFFAFIVTGVLALGLCAPIVSHETELTAQAATGTGYTSADDVEYVKSGKYIANWGARDEDCVFLSSYAESFYTGNYTFDVLSELSGGSSQANAPQSALYGELQDLMTSKQTYQTSYDATRDKFCYTDCVQSNYSKISSFYSGEVLSGTWDSGKTWNREHTWPDSKGDASGNGENDIMMLRPTSVKENSSRGNKAYGESGDYYDPNQHGQNVRGDCARIVLFVYTRWGNTNSMWGSSGVMENLNVLLKWMEEDPVDTWEMGRNDAVQSITGTRNVFVDYPEYAWLLFGKEVPENMNTPSGEASGGVVTPPSSGGDDTTTPDVGDGVVDGDPLASQIVTSPVAGKAYYLYMYQGNKWVGYYLSGGMDGYYMATTDNETQALPVYLENTSGGYHLYCYVDGVKTYINTVKSGTYTNGAYETTASTVYTFDATYNTLLDKEGYFFGTRGDKSYTTMGPCASDYLDENFVAHFIGTELPDDSTDTPVVPDDPDTPDTPTTGGGTEGNGEDECEHEYERWFTILRPTLTEEGKKTAFCVKCGHEETETIPMLTEEADTGSDADSNVEETEGCAATVGCVSLGYMALLAVGLYVRKRREDD